MTLASDILMNTALGMIIKNNLGKYNHAYGTLKDAIIIDTVMDPDEPYVEVELTFDDGGTEKLIAALSDFDNLPFCKLFNEVVQNEKKVNTTRWIGAGVYDVEHIELLSCEKCHFQTVHRFDYCPNCGRIIINNEGE